MYNLVLFLQLYIRRGFFIMDKIAQKRSLLNKLREVTDIGGIAVEKLFNPDFKKLMDRLRKTVDDPIRAIVSGETIGSARVPGDPVSLKVLLRSSKSNFNRREYMKAVADLGRFHKKCSQIVQILSSFQYEVDKIHEKFLLKGLDNDSKKYLHDLKTRMAQPIYMQFIKEAALDENFIIEKLVDKSKDVGKKFTDIYTNLFTEKGMALRGWEKRYPEQVGKLKEDTESVIGQFKSFLYETILPSLERMADARATRNPEKYIEYSNNIIIDFKTIDDAFKKYYQENVKGFLEKQELIAPVKKDDTGKANELNQQPIAVTVKSPPSSSSALTNIRSPSPSNEIAVTEPGGPPIFESVKVSPNNEAVSVSAPTVYSPRQTNQGPYKINIAPPGRVGPASSEAVTNVYGPATDRVSSDQSPTLRGPGFIEDEPYYDDGEPPTPVLKDTKKAAHAKFYNSLKLLAQEPPEVLARHIKSYATKIQGTDPKTAIRLFKIVRSIGK